MRVIAAAIILFATPGIVLAQADRSRSWEWSFAALYQESKSMGSQGGSTLDVSDDIGLGVNVGYNFSNRLTLGFDLDYLSPDYRAVLIDDSAMPAASTTIDHKFSQWNGRFKGTFNFLEGPFTPFVEAGLGWTNIDSNVADGPPITGCWWHPWWGYICSNFYNTFSTTTFTYGAGLGFRYHFRGGTFLKASYNVWELNDVGAAGDSSIGGARIEYGWGF